MLILFDIQCTTQPLSEQSTFIQGRADVMNSVFALQSLGCGFDHRPVYACRAGELYSLET